MINTLKYVVISSTYYVLNINYFCQNIMHVFICAIFLIQAHGVIKYIVNMWENVCFCNNIYYHFAKDIAFFISRYTTCVYHD